MTVKKYEGSNSSIDIDEEKCTGCRECVDACVSNIFEIVDGKSHAINMDDCSECCACISVCETGAIKHSSC